GVQSHDRVVVCYVASWATYRSERGQFNVEHIDPNLCTHIVYAFAGLNATSHTIKSLDPFNDLEENFGKGSFKKMTNLKLKYPHLKVTIAIGGWNEGSVIYSTMAADPEARKTFTKSVMDLIMKYNFDGLDLDWEYPGQRNGTREDKANFIELIKDLRTELLPGKHLLTAALGANIDVIKGAYDLQQINKYLDYIHLMCYDYHGSWENVTGANAPLYSNRDDLSVEKSVRYLLENGVNSHKLIMGVPLYGRTYLLEGETSNGIFGEPSITSKGFQGPFTRTDGFLGYNEICTELNKNSWQLHWDNASSTSIATMGNKVISYDDQNSLREKVKFAVSKNLGGVMVWTMDTDDFRGDCSMEGSTSVHRNYPMLNTLNDAMAEYLVEMNTVDSNDKLEPNSALSFGSSSMLLLLTCTVVFL
ncbi:hypothetical protein AAG570_010612, partial [Ranatra chinensis]